MRSIRTKKIKNSASKYLVGPYDDSLIQIQLDKNEKCLQEISKGLHMFMQIISPELHSSYDR
jgi:ribosomal protein S17E